MSPFPQFHSTFRFFLSSLFLQFLCRCWHNPFVVHFTTHWAAPVSSPGLFSPNTGLFCFLALCVSPILSFSLLLFCLSLSQQYRKLLYGHPLLLVQWHVFILRYLLSILFPFFYEHNCWFSLFQPWLLSVPKQIILLLQLCWQQL